MSADQNSRDAAVTSADQIGKVFVAVCPRHAPMLDICDCVFKKQETSAHVNVVCMPDASRRGVDVTTTSVMIDLAT
jgi:hypothetical protein